MCSEKGDGGIKIIEFDKPTETDPGFAATTIAALRLVETTDPRRYRRIQRHVKFIRPDRYLDSSGTYQSTTQCCAINYDQFKRVEYPEWDAWRYATVLVHEATHGAVHARWIPYSEKTRVRIERLCCTEEKRFAALADNHERQWSAALVKDFDERNWHEVWNDNIFKRLKRWITRRRETR